MLSAKKTHLVLVVVIYKKSLTVSVLTTLVRFSFMFSVLLKFKQNVIHLLEKMIKG